MIGKGNVQMFANALFTVKKTVLLVKIRFYNYLYHHYNIFHSFSLITKEVINTILTNTTVSVVERVTSVRCYYVFRLPRVSHVSPMSQTHSVRKISLMQDRQFQ